MRILIADDEKSFVEPLSDRLIRKGHQVESAYNGLSALMLIKKNKYDIILLDHNMPELTGLELVTYIRKNKIDTKLVMITGYMEIDKSFMEAIGVDDYLTKPVKLTDVDAVLAKYSRK